jgi:hypothetical protein
MGLFSKRSATSAEIERLTAEIASMASRLDAADAAKTELGERVDGIANGLADPIERLAADLVSMADRLDAADAAKTELGERVDGIVTRLDTPLGPPPTEPPPTPIDHAEFARLREEVAAIFGRLAGVDARITAISTELANQLDELGREIDAAKTASSGDQPGPVDTSLIDTSLIDEAVDELRDAQTRLANEQARYQIAFRQDLAELADRLRRS